MMSARRPSGRGEFHALQWKNGVLTSVSAPPSPETAAAGTPENATKARCASSIILASAPGTPPEEPPADMRVRSQICVSNREVRVNTCTSERYDVVGGHFGWRGGDGDDDGLAAARQDSRSGCRRCREDGYIERGVDDEGHEAEESPEALRAVRARGEEALGVQGVQWVSARSSAL
jgi:hypothetical protein